MRAVFKGMMLAAPALLLVGAVGSNAAPAVGTQAMRFTDKGELIFPADYRNWTYLSSGFGMTYGSVPAADPAFDTVFVNPDAERAFRETGHWPEETVMVLEIRRSTSKGSINLHGAYQSGDPVGIEVHVRDSKRFRGGWGFFGFRGAAPAKMIGYDASCYSCHLQHAAVDTTFVQFYPTLLPIAKAKGTFSAAYLAEEAKASAGSVTP